MSRIGVVALLAIGFALCCSGIVFSGSDEEPAAAPQAGVSSVAAKDIDNDPRKLEISRVIDRRILNVFPDGTFRPSDPVNEDSFSKVVERMLIACPTMTKPDFKVAGAKDNMSRIRAITVILRCAADKTAVESIRDTDAILELCGDAKSIPAWAVKCAAFAIDRGYVEAGPKLRPLDPITRSELAGILAKCLAPSDGTSATPVSTDAAVTPAADGYTGLVVDCRGLGMRRCMSPEITSGSGEKVYPDLKNLPSIDFMEDHGLASFVSDVANAKRSGGKPLEVKAVRVDGGAKQIAVLSDTDRDTILAEEPKSHFLAGWNVTFIID